MGVLIERTPDRRPDQSNGFGPFPLESHVYQRTFSIRSRLRARASSRNAWASSVACSRALTSIPMPRPARARPCAAGQLSSVIHTGRAPSPFLAMTRRAKRTSFSTSSARRVYGCSATTSNRPRAPNL